MVGELQCSGTGASATGSGIADATGCDKTSVEAVENGSDGAAEMKVGDNVDRKAGDSAETKELGVWIGRAGTRGGKGTERDMGIIINQCVC